MARLRARMAAEGGSSLIELLVAMAIFTFVMGAALSLFEVAVKSAPKDQERAVAVREAQTGLSGMTRRNPNAYDIVELTPNAIDFLVARQGVNKRVRYECGVTDNDITPALKKCQRSEATLSSPDRGPLPATGTPRKVIGRMLNGTAADPVLSYTMPPMEPLDPRGRSAGLSRGQPGLRLHPVGLRGGRPAAKVLPPSLAASRSDVKVKVPAKGDQKAACNSAGLAWTATASTSPGRTRSTCATSRPSRARTTRAARKSVRAGPSRTLRAKAGCLGMSKESPCVSSCVRGHAACAPSTARVASRWSRSLSRSS